MKKIFSILFFVLSFAVSFSQPSPYPATNLRQGFVPPIPNDAHFYLDGTLHFSAPPTIPGNTFNVKDPLFQAKGDGQVATDAAMAAGADTIYSNQATFVQADTGKIGYIKKVGASGNDTVFKIITFVSVHKIVINVNASTTASGCIMRWGHDDTGPIQAAIDTCYNRGGGTVFLPNGMYMIGGQLITSDNLGNNPQSQLYIPTAGRENINDSPYVAMRITGENIAWTNWGPLNNDSAQLFRSGTILFSCLTANYGSGQVIGSGYAINTGFSLGSFVYVDLDNITIMIPDGLRGTYRSGVNFQNLEPGENISYMCIKNDIATQQSHSPFFPVFGMAFTASNNGIAITATGTNMTNCFYYGFVIYEHLNAFALFDASSYNSFYFPGGAHACHISTAKSSWAPISILSASTSSAADISIDQLDMEGLITGTGKWYDYQTAIWDSLNHLNGTISYIFISSGLSSPTSTFAIKGGLNVQLFQLGDGRTTGTTNTRPQFRVGQAGVIQNNAGNNVIYASNTYFNTPNFVALNTGPMENFQMYANGTHGIIQFQTGEQVTAGSTFSGRNGMMMVGGTGGVIVTIAGNVSAIDGTGTGGTLNVDLTDVYPVVNNATKSGKSGQRWSGVFSVLGNFSGELSLAASTTSAATANIPEGSAPTSPVAGDLFAQTSDHNIYWRNGNGVSLCLSCGVSVLTRQNITSGSGHTVTGGNYLVKYDYSTTQASETLTTPASPNDQDIVDIQTGTTLPAPGVEITSFTIQANSGQTLNFYTPVNGIILYSGAHIKIRYNATGTYWDRLEGMNMWILIGLICGLFAPKRKRIFKISMMKKILIIPLLFLQTFIFGQGNPFNLQHLGQIYNKNSWSSTTDFDLTNLTVGVVSNKLKPQQGTAANYTKLLSIHGDTTCLNTFKYTVKVKLDSLATTGAAFGVGINSVNTTFAVSFMARMSFAAASPSTSQIFLDTDPATSWGNIFSTSSGNKLSASTGDYVTLTIDEVNTNTIIIAARNVTTNSSVIDTTYIYVGSGSNSAINGIHNTGQFSFFSQSTGYTIDSIAISSDEIVGATLALFGDSKTQGIGPFQFQNAYANLLSYYYGSVVNLGGTGDKTNELRSRLAEIISLHPKQVLLWVSRNDIANGISSGTWQANYTAITNALIAAGIDVINLLPAWESGLNQTAAVTFINANYPANKIVDIYDPTQIPGSVSSADNIHPSDTGALRIVAAIRAANVVITSKPFYNPNVPAVTPTLDQVLHSGPTSTDSLSLPGDNNLAVRLTVGSMGFQSNNRTNVFWFDNMFYNGGYHYNAGGNTASALLQSGGDHAALSFPSGSGLISTFRYLYYYTHDGSFGLGLITTNGSPYTGATLVGFANGRVAIGSTTDNATAITQLTTTGGAQLALHYDATHYATSTTASTGTQTNSITGSASAYFTWDHQIQDNGYSPNLTSKSGAYTVTATDHIINVDATSGAVTITLPASWQNHQEVTIIKTDNSGNAVTVSTNGNNVNGVTTSVTLSAQWKYVTIVAINSTNAEIIGSN